MNYRHKKCFNVITFPEGNEEEDRGDKYVCCDPERKLGSTIDSINYKNDVIGVVIKGSSPSDIVAITIEKCGIVGPLAQLGDVLTAPQDNLLFGFIYDVRQYLLAYGPGKYTVNIVWTIGGVPGGYVWGEYYFKQYTIPNAKGTVRVWSEFNSKYEKLNMDFTNSNYRDSVRFKGIFGFEKQNIEINNLVDVGKTVVKTTRQNLNTFSLLTDPLRINIGRRLLKWHFINEDVCLISDHNKRNYDRKLFDVPVALEDLDDPDYIEGSRFVKISASFGDRNKTDKSYYNLQ